MNWDEQGPDAAARSALMVALNLTAAAEVRAEHLLIAMLDEPGSELTQACTRLRPESDAKDLREALIKAARAIRPKPSAGAWSDEIVSPGVREMVGKLHADDDWLLAEAPRREALLAVAALRIAKPRIRD